MSKDIEINPRTIMKALAAKLNASDEQLICAQNMASAILEDSKNHCAITMSSLLIFNQLYPVGIYKGRENLQAGALDLAKDLKGHGWKATNLADIAKEPFDAGDIGVVDDGHGTHHIYLILDASDQKNPKIADNQAPPHKRPVEGGQMNGVGGATVTKYFLRAPDIKDRVKLLEQVAV